MLTEIIPSYLYWQYQDEPVNNEISGIYAIAGVAIAGEAIAGTYPAVNPKSDLQAFVDAYNELAQQMLNSMNLLGLPVYTGLSGNMLDWAAEGIYGIQRPTLPVAVAFSPEGVYNTEAYNVLPYNWDVENLSNQFYPVTDDYFKRIITWNFYKGDGFQYTTTWLKRRVKRFINGVNGVNPDIQDTYEISVTYAGNTVTISVADSYPALILQAAIDAGVVYLPFQYTYVVDLI